MTKVEELRMDIIAHSTLIQPHQLVDSLILAIMHQTQTQCKEAIAAAHAEGVAGGAEQERERIKRTCLDGIGVWDGYVMVPDAVLAPTKESEK